MTGKPKTADLTVVENLPPWKPVVVDHIPILCGRCRREVLFEGGGVYHVDDMSQAEAGCRKDELLPMYYAILLMPSDPFEWMVENLDEPSPYVAVFFVPELVLDVEKVRQDCREFEVPSGDIGFFSGRSARTFPEGYLITGARTVLDHCFNVVLPIPSTDSPQSNNPPKKTVLRNDS